MPINIELKARMRCGTRQRKLAESLATGSPTLIEQVDTFFRASNGRLKLREFAPDRGELIHYHRPDRSGPKQSFYSRVQTNQPGALRQMLADALDIRGVVRKKRSLYLVDQTRIHLDDVDGLGEFLELEVVLRPGQSAEEGERIAERIKHQLEVHDDDLIDCAYIDLMERRAKSEERGVRNEARDEE